MTAVRAEAEAKVRAAIRGTSGQCLLDGLVWPWMQLTPRKPRHVLGPWPPTDDVAAAFALLDEDVPTAWVEELVRAEEGAVPTEQERQRFEDEESRHGSGWQLPAAADLSAHTAVDQAWRRIDPTGRVGSPAGLLCSVRWWPGRDAHADPAALGGVSRASQDDPDRWQREVVDALLDLVTKSSEPVPAHWMIAATDYRIRSARWRAAISDLAASLHSPSGRCLLATVVAAVAAQTDGPPAASGSRLPVAAGAIRAAFERLGDPVEDHALRPLLAAEPGAQPGAVVRTPVAVIEGLDGMWGPAERTKPPESWQMPRGTDTEPYERAWAQLADPRNDLPTGVDVVAGADWLLSATDRRVRARLAAQRAAPSGAAKRRTGWRRWLPWGDT